MVYFIQQENGGPIKIGYTKNNIQGRLSVIQAHSPFNFKLIYSMEGTSKTETAIHKEFESDRIKNEWFNPSPRLLEFIKSPWSLPIPKNQERSG